MFNLSPQFFINITQGLWKTLQRFPLTVSASIVLTITGIMMPDNGNHQELVEKLVAFSILALPLFTSLALLGERFKNRMASIVAQVVGLILLLIYYFVFDIEQFDIAENAMPFFFSIAAALFLLLASPFFLHLESSKDDAWHFDRALVTRFLFTFVFGLVLFIGLMLALTATKFLFDLDFHLERWFFKIWILVVGVFGILFFLRGIPKQEDTLVVEYPKPLKILFFGILVPLLCLFTIILYGYVLRMLVTWSWPKDGVAQWILGFSAVGITCFLIGYPLLSVFARLRKAFFLLFGLYIPLLIILFVGIGIRIAAHGATINRLIVLMLGIWVTAVVLFALISRLKVAIKYIPLSLAVFIVITSFGPWSIFNTAKQNQLSRLERILVDNGMLKDGAPVKGPHGNVSPDDTSELFSILDYLSQSHELYGKRAWLDTVIGNKEVSQRRYREKLQTYFGLTIFYKNGTRMPAKMGEGRFSLGRKDPTPLHVEGYQYMMGERDQYQFDSNFTLPGQEGTFRSTYSGAIMKIFRGDMELFSVNAEPLLHTLIAKRYAGTSSLSNNELQVDVENSNGKARFYITRVNLTRKDGRLMDVHLEGVFLFSLK